MIPELGRYAAYVLAAYGAGIAVLLGVTLWSFARAAKVRARLRDVEDSHD